MQWQQKIKGQDHDFLAPKKSKIYNFWRRQKRKHIFKSNFELLFWTFLGRKMGYKITRFSVGWDEKTSVVLIIRISYIFVWCDGLRITNMRFLSILIWMILKRKILVFWLRISFEDNWRKKWARLQYFCCVFLSNQRYHEWKNPLLVTHSD